jgi:hypothetical protein
MYDIVHPLNDLPEQKILIEGPMRLTKGTKIALFVLRVYLILMLIIVIWKFIHSF